MWSGSKEEREKSELGVEIPSPSIGGVVGGDLLDLEILFEAKGSEISADSTHLDASPRGVAEAGLRAVDPNDSRAEEEGHAVASLLVLRFKQREDGKRKGSESISDHLLTPLTISI